MKKEETEAKSFSLKREKPEISFLPNLYILKVDYKVRQWIISPLAKQNKRKRPYVKPADTERGGNVSEAGCRYLQSCCARNDLNQLLRDDSLAGSIERQSQFVNHLSYKQNKGIRQHNLTLRKSNLFLNVFIDVCCLI